MYKNNDAYVVLPTGEWLPLGSNDIHFDVIKRSGFLNDFNEDEPNAYKYFNELGYTDDDEICDKDEEAFDDIEFEYTQRAVAHALKKGVLRIRYFKTGKINRNKNVILIAGDINLITVKIIETAFEKFNAPDNIILSIENIEGKEVFSGTYDNFLEGMKNENKI